MTIQTRFIRRLTAFFVLVGAGSAMAATRTHTLTAPSTVKPGDMVQVLVAAGTDAADGEQIGFFHSEYSTDGGKTWVPVYAEKVGTSATRPIDFKAGAEGTRIIVRSHIAFRGGQAGDVDYAGAPIAWQESWDKWQAPPAKYLTIRVTAK
ncbi:MAG TPA: hypothetical protein VGD97_05000 [Lacunisphaera sp.]